MALLFTCPGCGKRLLSKKLQPGLKVKCPGCGGLFTLSQQAAPTPARVEKAIPASKQSPSKAPTDQADGIHPALWGLIGGLGVAVAAIIIALVIPRGGKLPVGEAEERDKPARRSIDQADSKPILDQAPGTKSPLSAEALYARASPGVVTITCKSDWVLRAGIVDKDGVLDESQVQGEDIVSGSGFFLKAGLVNDQGWRAYDVIREKDGKAHQVAYVLTNYHVIEPAVDATVQLIDGSKGIVMQVVTEDEAADLALLAVLVFSGNPLTQLQFAESSPLVGRTVYAIGNPQGFANSLSPGIISGGVREIKPGASWLQTTAPISHGSTGGPLFNAEGEVIGVTTAFWREGQNLNFAVPVSEVRRLLAGPYRQRKLWNGRSIDKQYDEAFSELETYIQKRAISGAGGIKDDKMLMASRKLWEAACQPLDQRADPAIQALSRAMPFIPPEFRYLAHYVLGKGHYQLAANKQARESSEAKTAAEVEDSYRNFRNSEHAKSSLESLKEATRLNSRFAPTYDLLADYYSSAGEFAVGLGAADWVVKMVPHCAKAYCKRGQFFVNLHRPKSALQDFQVSAKLNPRDPNVHMEIANLCFDLHEYEKCIESCEIALSMKTSFRGSCQFRIGNAYQELGKYQQAIDAYHKAKSSGESAEACDLGISICRQAMMR